MSSYIPFARKYRPQKFSDLVGQEVLVKTLSYCINHQKLTGAILLTGIRGVGKTSSARIIAKTINCSNLGNNGAGDISPCDKCKNCESFREARHPDIIEIDAASKTGVDDVREIIESSEYKPLLGKYKIFIIDEVHMLSRNAFNALLKLIEEPPAHVIFIFATTEVQKIPLTVISRCQRYDLRRLTFDEVSILLQKIAIIEKVEYEEEALKIIALQSEGSARDAIVIFDQASSYVHNQDGKSGVTADSVNRMLGLVNIGTILKLVQLIVVNNPKAAIDLLEKIYKNTSSLEFFIQQLSYFIANLTKEKIIPGFYNPLYINYTNEIADILAGTSLSRLSILWQIFSQGVGEVRISHNELIAAEMLVIKAIYSCNLPKIEQITGIQASTSYEMTGDKGSAVSEDIYDFLKFCHSQNEMSLYYFLLNEIEVKHFVAPDIELAYLEKNTQEKLLKSILSKWSGLEWNVGSVKQSEIISLKQKLFEKAKNSEDFATIKNHFPNADISDIILKK